VTADGRQGVFAGDPIAGRPEGQVAEAVGLVRVAARRAACDLAVCQPTALLLSCESAGSAVAMDHAGALMEASSATAPGRAPGGYRALGSPASPSPKRSEPWPPPRPVGFAGAVEGALRHACRPRTPARSCVDVGSRTEALRSAWSRPALLIHVGGRDPGRDLGRVDPFAFAAGSWSRWPRSPPCASSAARSRCYAQQHESGNGPIMEIAGV